MFLEQTLRFLGSLICHQIGERTLVVNHMLLPLCARDTGIYLGAFVSIVFLGIKRRVKSNKPPNIQHTIMLSLLMLPMMFDGALSYMGLKQTDNLTRLLTGGMFGLPIPIFLTVARNYNANMRNMNPVLNSWSEIGALLFALLTLLFTVYFQILIPWIVISLLLISTIIATYYMFADAVASLFYAAHGYKRSAASFFILCSAFAAIYTFDKLFFWPVKGRF